MAIKRELYDNILISGGTSMLPGFPTRLKDEVQKKFQQRVLKGGTSSSIKIRVIDTPSRKYNVFIGASIVAKEMESSKEGWRTKQEYEEKGKARLAQ